MKKLGQWLGGFVLVSGLCVISFMVGAQSQKNGWTPFQNENNMFVSTPKLEQLENMIQKNFLFPVDKQKLEDGIYKGLMQGLDDPYSMYMTPDEYKKLMESTSGEYAGVGLVVSAGEDNRITVVSPIDGTPAASADIKTGDKIVGINDQQYLGSELDKAVDQMRGEAGTKVKLTIQRTSESENKIFDVELTRANITLKTVTSEVMGDLGYMAISQFDKHTPQEFMQHKKELEDKGVKGIVLDLRGNPGGLLTSVLSIADELLPEGVIVKTVDKNGHEQIENSDSHQDKIPMVVLINKGSASASEILAGALKDHKRAPIVGTVSYGKGIVQQIFPLTDGSGVKMTISEYFTPNGTRIHKVGVVPDFEVELPKDVKEIGPKNVTKDLQLQKAIDLLNH